MSVNSISTWSWSAPPPWQSTASNSAASGSSELSGPSEFQQLASDVQAVLAQGQTQTASGTATSGTSATANPAQQLATDLQTFAQLQNSQSSSDPATQAPAHHHHHHGGGAADASGTSGSSTSSTASTAASSNSATGLPQALSGDFMQILQAYGSQVAASTTSSLTTA